ncbi:MAG: hypothetical protein ACI921_001896, partial [Polaribacter sp.]
VENSKSCNVFPEIFVFKFVILVLYKNKEQWS